MLRKNNFMPLTLLATLVSLQVGAAGYQVGEHSASGLGRAFAGEAAIADNAAVMARNPAAMTRFDTTAISGALTAIDPNIDVEYLASTPEKRQTAEDVAPLALVPAAYMLMPINNDLVVGLAMFSSYGVTTDYSSDFAVGSAAGKTSLTTFNINPNLAYKVNEHISVGGGISYIYSMAELARYQGDLHGAMGGSSYSDNLVDMDGDGHGYSWNAGALIEIDENNRLGFSYRSQADIDLSGDFTDHVGSVISGTGSSQGDLSIVLPATAEFSGYHAFGDLALHYSVLWTQWSEFTELRATGEGCSPGFDNVPNLCLLKEEHYEDNLRYALGATYKINRSLTVRAGAAFDEQAGQATLSIPDTDRIWYSAGLTYQLDRHLSVDLGFSYLTGKEIEFTEKDAMKDEKSFKSSGGAILSAAQINYLF